jgi:diguanylate cyclase (GGDEF)-like protein
MAQSSIDYDALATQARQPSIDYDALAQQARGGATLVAEGGALPPQTKTAGAMSPEAEEASRQAQSVRANESRLGMLNRTVVQPFKEDIDTQQNGSVWDRLKMNFMRGANPLSNPAVRAIGNLVTEGGQKVSDLVADQWENLKPGDIGDVTVPTGGFGSAKISGEDIRKLGQQYLAPAAEAAATKILAPMAQPESIALMGGSKAIPVAGAAGRLIRAGSGMAFGVPAAQKAIEAGPAAMQAASEGNTPEAVRLGTEALFNAAVAGETLGGAAREAKGATADIRSLPKLAREKIASSRTSAVRAAMPEDIGSLPPQAVLGVEQIFKAAAPTGMKPEFRGNLYAAAGDLSEVGREVRQKLKATAGGISNPDMRVRATVDALNDHLREMYQTERAPQIARNADNPVAMNLGEDARNGLDYLSGFAGKSADRALAKGSSGAESITLAEADKLARVVNQELHQFESLPPESRSSVLATNPKIGGLADLDQALGTKINEELARRGEPGIKEYERRYAALSQIRSQLQARMNAVELSQPGVLKKVVKPVTSLLTGTPSGIASASQAAVSDVNIGRALQKGFDRLANTNLSANRGQAMPVPMVRGLLAAPATILPQQIIPTGEPNAPSPYIPDQYRPIPGETRNFVAPGQIKPAPVEGNLFRGLLPQPEGPLFDMRTGNIEPEKGGNGSTIGKSGSPANTGPEGQGTREQSRQQQQTFSDNATENAKLSRGNVIPRKVHGVEQPTEPSAASSDRRAESRGPDLRQDLQTRKKVSEMSPEERAHALLTSDQTGLPNRRAFEESDAKALPSVGFMDLDNFKQANDQLGHEGVDTVLLPAVGKLADRIGKETGVQFFHRSGDEFLARSADHETTTAAMERLRNEMAGAEFTYHTPDGRTLTKKGQGASYGTGANADEAEAATKLDKQGRAERGLRFERDEGVSQGAPEGKQAGEGDVSQRQASQMKPESGAGDKSTQPKQDSPSTRAMAKTPAERAAYDDALKASMEKAGRVKPNAADEAAAIQAVNKLRKK